MASWFGCLGLNKRDLLRPGGLARSCLLIWVSASAVVLERVVLQSSPPCPGTYMRLLAIAEGFRLRAWDFKFPVCSVSCISALIMRGGDIHFQCCRVELIYILAYL